MIEEWLEEEVGEGGLVKVLKDNITVKIWCEKQGLKERILDRKDEWEKKGIAKVEEWLSVRERVETR